MSVIVKFLQCGRNMKPPSFFKVQSWEEGGRRGFKPKRKVVEESNEPIKTETKKELKLDKQPDKGNVTWKVLLRPTLFTITFAGGTFGSCAIWQYENMRKAALKTRLMHGGEDLFGLMGQRKAPHWREEVRRWWARQSDSEKLFWSLFSVNLVVWAGWQLPVLQPFMMKWFLQNPASKTRCLPLILSTFSHANFLHFGVNMYVLHSFMDKAVYTLGVEQFLGFYLSAGVCSSLASMALKVGSGRIGSSLGASGAICGVVGLFATLYPDSRLQIILLPFFTFTAAMGLKGLMLAESAGVLMGWKLFDHMAHLSGLMLGVTWCYYGNAYIWEKREQLVTRWHNFRDLKNKRK